MSSLAFSYDIFNAMVITRKLFIVFSPFVSVCIGQDAVAASSMFLLSDLSTQCNRDNGQYYYKVQRYICVGM